MQIAVRDSNEFNSLLHALADEIVDAKIYFNLHQGLVAAFAEYEVEFGQSWTFWSLTLRAHTDAVLVRLCKAYDQFDRNNPSLNLGSLLGTIKANMHLFDETDFRERLKDNPYVNSLAKTVRRPDAVQLQKDLDSVSKDDPLVKKLTIWRHNYYAHRSRQHALDADAFSKQHPFLSIEEIEALLKNGVAIMNRYSHLFSATLHSTHMIGHDDYLSVLEAVRRDLKAQEAQIQKELAAANAAMRKAADA